MKAPAIDVWDVNTFDQELTAKLRANTDLIRDTMLTDRKLYREREATSPKGAYGDNPYKEHFLRLLDEIGCDMRTLTIRAWHYTRLTDGEVEKIRATGIYPATLETLRQRHDAAIAAGLFTSETAAALFAVSPFHKQLDVRSNRFWMTSNPIVINDARVRLLLGSWGGESTYFWLEDPALQELVARIGTPRVLEIAVPLRVTDRAYEAGRTVISSFGKSLGCGAEIEGFDLYAVQALGPDTVIAIHSQGDPNFAALGQGYPIGFVDG
jgi:hypothetical protein